MHGEGKTLAPTHGLVRLTRGPDIQLQIPIASPPTPPPTPPKLMSKRPASSEEAGGASAKKPRAISEEAQKALDKQLFDLPLAL